MILEHAPDYRESFLRELGKHVRLTVVAQPCQPSGLVPPVEREGYHYVELPVRKFRGFVYQPELREAVRSSDWDVICAGFNVRHISRMALFLRSPELHRRWIWWGHIVGRARSWASHVVRRSLLTRASACLTYTEPQAELVTRLYGVPAYSFNNSEVSVTEFRRAHFDMHEELRFLFVGRNQPRKRLERLVQLARRWDDIHVRFVGSGMETLQVPDDLRKSGRVGTFGHTRGDALNAHFDWADLVVNPGHVGLLVMTAARYGKGIAIDSESDHAPEYWLAKSANQPFLSFGDLSEVEAFLNDLRRDRDRLRRWGTELQKVAMEKYTIEHMVRVHLEVFQNVATLKSR